MAVALSISVEGMKDVQAMLDRVNPKTNPAYVRRSMLRCAELVQIISSTEMIIQGSRFRGPKGPRGGKGKMTSAGTHPSKLTSRHGGAGIVGSIRVNESPLPWAVEIGSDKKYAPVHEYGGSVGVRSTTVKSHTRTMAFGKKVSVFTVPQHFRSGHYADYPPRPFLGPGLDKASKSFSDIFAREIAKEIR